MKDIYLQRSLSNPVHRINPWFEIKSIEQLYKCLFVEVLLIQLAFLSKWDGVFSLCWFNSSHVYYLFHLLLYSEKVLACAFLKLINEYRLSKVFDRIFWKVFLKRPICRHERKIKKEVFRINWKLASWWFHIKSFISCLFSFKLSQVAM